MKNLAWVFFPAILLILGAASARAETVELVTYYPASFSGEADRFHAGRATIGDPYSMANPTDANLPNGTFLIADSLGIGPGFGATLPAGALHVVGQNGAVDRALFMPGTGAGSEIRVGIGTVAPGGILDLRQDDAVNPAVVRLWNNTGSSNVRVVSATNVDSKLQFTNSTTWTSAIVCKNDFSNENNNALSFRVRGAADANTEAGLDAASRMTILGSGNVGIRITDPTTPLETVGPLKVVHGLGNRNHQVEVGTTTPYGAPAIGFWADLRPGGSNLAANSLPQRGAAIVVDGGNTGGRMMFTAAPNATQGTTWQPQSDTTSIMTFLLDSGRVGIGTTNPQSKLEVRQANNAYGIVTSDGTTVTGMGVDAVNGFVGTSTNHAMRLVANGGLAELLLLPNGDVGIGGGGFTPSYLLHVNGLVRAEGGFSGPGVPSDLRFKSEVKPLQGVLGKLDQLHGVSFKWNKLYESQGYPGTVGKKDVGLIAQEVEAVYPELVNPLGKSGYKAVDYSRFSAVLLEAVKELKAENERIKGEIEELRKKVSAR